MVGFSRAESPFFPIDVVKNICRHDPLFEGMMDFSLSVHSAHLSCMNTALVFDKPWPNCLRLFTTICDPDFANMVIDNSI